MPIENERGDGYVFKGFAGRLRVVLTARKISQAHLAMLIGKTPRVVSMYLAAERIPRADVLTKMAGALGVTTDYLCVGMQPGEGVFRGQIRDIASLAIELSPRDLKSLWDFTWGLKYGSPEVRALLEQTSQAAHLASVVHLGHIHELLELRAELDKAEEKLGLQRPRKDDKIKRGSNDAGETA